MNKQLDRSWKQVAIFLIGAVALFGSANAQQPHSNSVIVEQPESLPELARDTGIALDLNTDSGDGSAYLYVEQEDGRRLVVFNVSDPARLRVVRVIKLSAAGPFDFVKRVGGSSILIRYRNDQREALLDVHKAKAPELKTLSGTAYFGRLEALAPSTYLAISDPVLGTSKAPRDYQVIDASNPADPAVLYTARTVIDSTTRDETGTTFLLGESGLTIVRNPEMEEQYAVEQMVTN